MIILASQSPRRKQLLEQAEIAFKIIVKETEENIPPNTDVTEVPIIIAKAKAEAILSEVSNDDVIIAADTIVHLNGSIIGKPKNEEDAFKILTSLNGQVHQVITGVYLIKNNKNYNFSSTTQVHFNHLSNKALWHYIKNYKPYDKAGAYAIQEWIGAVGVAKIDGCFYNVMGLPISQLVSVLKNEFKAI